MHSFNIIIVTTGIIISAFSRKENTHMQVKSHEKLTLMITLFKYYIHGNLDVNDKHKVVLQIRSWFIFTVHTNWFECSHI